MTNRNDKIAVLLAFVVVVAIFFFASKIGREESPKTLGVKDASEPEMLVNAMKVVPPDETEPYAKFYWVKNQWGYGLVQFKDVDLNKKLDKVFLTKLEISTTPGRRNEPDMYDGWPSENTVEPNSPDWDLWLERFEKTLQEYEKKLKWQGQKRSSF